MTYIDNSFNDQYAKAWYSIGGDFSYIFSKKLLAYLKKNNLEPKSILDIYCGSGNLLAEFQKAGLKCVGTEGSKAFIEFNKENYHDIDFIYTEELEKFGTKEKFDLVTCTNDIVNYMETFSEWQTFFKNVADRLNKDGMFVFDFNTTRRLADWNKVTFDQSRDIDFVQSITSNVHGKAVINYVFYVREGDKYSKASTVYTETSFETSQVVEALKKAGFKNVKLCDFELNELASPEARNKIHVVATK